MYSFMSLSQMCIVCMHVHHLLKTENTEFESNFLKSTLKLKTTIYEYLLIKNNVCYMGQLGSVGISDLIPCKTLL